MGRHTIYRRKNLTKSGLREFIKPYLLKGIRITHANQVWCTDITYIPMKRGFMYMTAIIDVYSRKIVGWGISNSMSAQWCKNVLKDAIAAHGKPAIVNSDQGSQYTSKSFIEFCESVQVTQSMSKAGYPYDNAPMERYFNTLKNDLIYQHYYRTEEELYTAIEEFAYLQYNHVRPHSYNNYKTPYEARYGSV